MKKQFRIFRLLASAFIMTFSLVACGGDDGGDNGGGSSSGGGGSTLPKSVVGEWWTMIDGETGLPTSNVNNNTQILVENVKANGQITETTYYYSAYTTDRVTAGWNYEVENLTYTLSGNQISITDSKGKQTTGTFYLASNDNTTIFVITINGKSQTWGVMTNEVREIISSLHAVAYKKGNGGNGGNTGYNPCPDNNHPHLIDLDLPSGTKWACCNVGASAPNDYGNYFAWHETIVKKLNDQNSSESYTFQEESNSWSNGYDISGTQYDVARVKWGEPWKMPTKAQCAELYQYTTMSWTTLNGVYCIQLTASNGNSIYLPAVGGVWNGDKIAEGDGGSYWSSTYSSRGYATTHNFKYGEAPNGNGIDYIDRGHAVRPITGGSGGGVDFSSIGGKYTTTDCKYYSDEKAFYEMEPTYEMTITTNTKYPTTVQIYNFWMGKKTITGELNTETGDITIATGQIIDEDETYGNIWVTPYSETLTLTYDKDKRSYVSNYFVPRCNEGHFGCYFIKMVHQ